MHEVNQDILQAWQDGINRHDYREIYSPYGHPELQTGLHLHTTLNAIFLLYTEYSRKPPDRCRSVVDGGKFVAAKE